MKIYPDEEGEERVGDYRGEVHERGEEVIGGEDGEHPEEPPDSAAPQGESEEA